MVTQYYFNFLKIFDGNSTEASVLATLCGSIKRRTFFTSGNEVFIMFTADQNGTDSGFEGVFTFHEDNCHGIINTTGSLVTSPNFPQKYGNFLKCDFVVTVPDKGKVSEINFFKFDLDNKEHCLGDSVKIFDGGKTSTFPSIKLCGSNLPPSFISHSSFVIIRFTSDEAEAGSGFQIQVNFISGLYPSVV
ncbi:Cubilin [Holothuria leucospilota]|uniref:Cubilin n=1 Tax=Holothuria leucospilota TaxID=206669 RepID=A0A9Q1HB91_HOLLE|nr:Cubilin [Holothuria leucospilota]